MNAKIPLGQSLKPKTAQALNHPRLSLWLSKLPNHSLPLNTRLTNRIRTELTDPNTTSERLSALIQQEPALCLKLFLRGHRQLQQREGDIQGMVHLLGLLGLNQIEAVLDKASTQNMPNEGQRELYAASMFAASLAETLLPLKHGTRGSHFYLPSLLFNSPLWLMWVAAPKLMQQSQQLASQKNQALKPLCKKKLGFSLQSLLKRTQVFLPLPNVTLKALRIDPQEQLKIWAKIIRSEKEELKRWFERDKNTKKLFYSIETGIYLINQYVLALYLDWHGKHKKRWTRLLCQHLELSSDTLEKQVVQVANDINMPSHLGGVYAPIYRYRGMHREQEVHTGNANLLQQYLKQLQGTRDTHNCLQITMEAMAEGAQVDHCLILPIDNNHLQSPLSYGFDDKEINRLDIDCNDCGQLLKALLKKPTAISIDQSKLNSVKRQLPSELTRYWQPRPCGVMSLFKGNKPYAIILCDHKEWSGERHQAFKAVGKQLTQTLKQQL